MKKCGVKREGLPDPEERVNCFCELCHGPMCNREILRSSGLHPVMGVWGIVLVLASVLMVKL